MATQDATTHLRVAKAYFDEFDELEALAADPQRARRALQELSHVDKELDEAERIDPRATLDGMPIRAFRAIATQTRGGIELYVRNNRSRAIDYFQQSVSIDPELASAYAGLAVAYRESGNKALAVEAIERAVALQPETVEFRQLRNDLHGESALKARLSAFRGSWKALLILAGLSAIGLLGAVTGMGSGVGPNMSIFVLFGATAAAYWWMKSR